MLLTFQIKIDGDEKVNQQHSQDQRIDKTWLLANGAGSFAMGTLAGTHTSRYQGFLIAAIDPPVNRGHLLHSVVDAALHTDGQRQDLATHLFGASFSQSPDGLSRLIDTKVNSRRIDWTYDIGRGLSIKRSLQMTQGEPTALVEWTLMGRGQVDLDIRPLLSFRDFHDLRHQDSEPISCAVDGLSVRASSANASMALELSTGRWQVDRQSWQNFAYSIDQQRGQAWQEQLEAPVLGTCSLTTEQPTVTLVARATSARPVTPLMQLSSSAQSSTDRTLERLEAASEAYVVRRLVPGRSEQGVSVIAGYPWFADWGRDAMISLPGLLLGRGSCKLAHEVLATFGSALLEGLIPNRFDDRKPSAHYNTADASLWYIQALGHLAQSELESDREHEMARHIETARQILHWYRRGTHFGIRVDTDGLVHAGSSGKALTWMDAICDGKPATPRVGKPVELSALWYSGLLTVAALTEDSAEATSLKNEAAVTADSFISSFWDEQRGCLFDVLVPDGADVVPDKSVRPNQIFACSLPHTMLTQSQQHRILEQVESLLLTPMGLRTLAPKSDGYCPRYEGSMSERDQAYHNGTVWPWLMGPYIMARLASASDPKAIAPELLQRLEPLLASMDDDCIGHIAEIYDGDAPHYPHGCRAQAWSVAEILRAVKKLNGLLNESG